MSDPDWAGCCAPWRGADLSPWLVNASTALRRPVHRPRRKPPHRRTTCETLAITASRWRRSAPFPRAPFQPMQAVARGSVEHSDSERSRNSARWVDEGRERTQGWGAHHACLAERCTTPSLARGRSSATDAAAQAGEPRAAPEWRYDPCAVLDRSWNLSGAPRSTGTAVQPGDEDG